MIKTLTTKKEVQDFIYFLCKNTVCLANEKIKGVKCECEFIRKDKITNIITLEEMDYIKTVFRMSGNKFKFENKFYLIELLSVENKGDKLILTFG